MKGSWGGAEAGAQGEGQGPAVTWDGHRVTAGSPLPAQGSVLFRWAGRLLTAWPTAGLRHKKLPPPTPCFAQRRCWCPWGPQGLVFSWQEKGGLRGGRGEQLGAGGRACFEPDAHRGHGDTPGALQWGVHSHRGPGCSTRGWTRMHRGCPGCRLPVITRREKMSSALVCVTGSRATWTTAGNAAIVAVCSLWFWPPLPRGPIHKEVVLASGDPSGHSPFIERSTHPYPPATAPCLLSQARVLPSSWPLPLSPAHGVYWMVPGNQGLPKASTEGLSSSHWPPPPPTGGRAQRWAWLLPWRLGRSAGVGTSGMALGAAFRGATLPLPGLCGCVCTRVCVCVGWTLSTCLAPGFRLLPPTAAPAPSARYSLVGFNHLPPGEGLGRLQPAVPLLPAPTPGCEAIGCSLLSPGDTQMRFQ